MWFIPITEILQGDTCKLQVATSTQHSFLVYYCVFLPEKDLGQMIMSESQIYRLS